MSVIIHHLEDVPWWEAPLPRKRHRCQAQTTGYDDGNVIDRCACGGLRRNGGPWIVRNERRKK